MFTRPAERGRRLRKSEAFLKRAATLSASEPRLAFSSTLDKRRRWAADCPTRDRAGPSMPRPFMVGSGFRPGFGGFSGEAPEGEISKLTYSGSWSSNLSEKAFRQLKTICGGTYEKVNYFFAAGSRAGWRRDRRDVRTLFRPGLLLCPPGPTGCRPAVCWEQYALDLFQG